MLSESIFTNLSNLRSAVKEGLIFSAATELATSNEKVLIVCIGVPDRDGMINIYPYGMIPGANLVNEAGKITDAGRKATNRLVRFLKDENSQAFFRINGQERIELVPSKIGKAPKTNAKSIFIFAWDNPYELFKDPAEMAKDAKEQSNKGLGSESHVRDEPEETYH
jgi:hypothetical protein